MRKQNVCVDRSGLVLRIAGVLDSLFLFDFDFFFLRKIGYPGKVFFFYFFFSFLVCEEVGVR